MDESVDRLLLFQLLVLLQFENYLDPIRICYIYLYYTYIDIFCAIYYQN